MSVYRVASAALAVAAVVALSSVADAQERPRGGDRGRGGPGGGFGFGGAVFGGFGGGQGTDTFSLLRSEGIQKELEIGDDQQRALAELREQMQRDLEAAQRQVRDQYQAKLDEVLLPHQAERVQEITLQLRGPESLLDAKVSKELGLSAAQISKLQGLRDNAERQRREAFAGGGGGPGGGDIQERMQQFREQRQQQEEAMLAILTPPQKAKFEEMKGKEFDRALLGGQGGPGGRGGFRGRPGN
jgi:Spy/CpxP family protein refolding chaperone